MTKTMKPVFFRVIRALPGCSLLAAMAIGVAAKECGRALVQGIRGEQS